MNETIQRIEDALTFLEALGYRSGDVRDGLVAALANVREALETLQAFIADNTKRGQGGAGVNWALIHHAAAIMG